jgi:hypothetical protein
MGEKDKKYWAWPKVIPLLGHDGPLSEADAASWQWEATEKTGEGMLALPEIVSNFTIYAVPDPDEVWRSPALPGTDCYQGDLKSNEWGALFFDVLGCPRATDEPSFPDESPQNWAERYMTKFEQAIPEYPMLARMWDVYGYASYMPGEVTALREECLKVQAATSNEEALSGLRSLLAACEEAVRSGNGLFLAGD